MQVEDIARVVHEANRALQIVTGDPAPSSEWDEAEQWQRDSAVEGVEKVQAGTTTPEEQHQAWCDAKIRDGWTYGPLKDPVAKTHPCLVPYDELDEGQRAKDHVFVAIVKALSA